MGAHFDSISVEACSKDELKEKFSQIQESLCHDDGNDAYAGHIGIAPRLSISDLSFKKKEDALDWLENNTQKWEAAIAVKVGDFTNLYPKTEAEKKLQANYVTTKEAMLNWQSDLIKKTKLAKSKQKTCTKCNSKISIAFIKTIFCPVCNDNKFLETETDIKKFKSLQEKNNELFNKIKEAKMKYKEKNKENFWLVGALCAS